MNGIKLTIEQKDAIQGVFCNENTFFNCVQDINGDWFIFLSENDREELRKDLALYFWLLDIQETEYIKPAIQNIFE
jgi:hypothetical protein